MNNFFKRNIDYFVVVVLAFLASLTWFKSENIISFGDLFPATFVNPDKWLNQIVYMWNNIQNGGGEPSYLVTFFTCATVSFIFNKLLIPYNIAHHIWVAFLYIFQGISIVYFLRTILPETKKIFIILGAVFYIFNFFLLFWIPAILTMYSFSLLPLIGALFIKAVYYKKTKYIVLIGFFSIFLSELFINPPTLAMFLIFMFIIYIFIIIQKKSLELSTVIRIIVIVILANLWWIIPVYFSLFGPGKVTVVATIDPHTWAWTMKRNSFLNLFWFNSTWGWEDKNYFPYNFKYNSLILLIVFVPTLLALGANLLKKKRDLITIYFLIVAVLILFICKGLHQPFSQTHLLLYKLPGFWLFREPASKFLNILIIVYSILIAIAGNELYSFLLNRYNYFRKKLLCSKIIIFVLMIIIIVIPFPLWTGEVIPDKGRPVLPPAHVKIPNYWMEMKKSQFRDKVLVLPNNDYYQVPYRWGMYAADTLPEEAINSDVVKLYDHVEGYTQFGGNYYWLTRVVLERMRGNNDIDLKRVLSLLGVKYIIQRNDVDYRFPGRDILSPREIKAVLKQEKSIKLIRSEGALDIYKINEKDWMPGVYGSVQPIWQIGDFKINLLKGNSLDIKKPVFLVLNYSQNVNPSRILIYKNNDKISKVKYYNLDKK